MKGQKVLFGVEPCSICKKQTRRELLYLNKDNKFPLCGVCKRYRGIKKFNKVKGCWYKPTKRKKRVKRKTTYSPMNKKTREKLRPKYGDWLTTEYDYCD